MASAIFRKCEKRAQSSHARCGQYIFAARCLCLARAICGVSHVFNKASAGNGPSSVAFGLRWPVSESGGRRVLASGDVAGCCGRPMTLSFREAGPSGEKQQQLYGIGLMAAARARDQPMAAG